MQQSALNINTLLTNCLESNTRLSSIDKQSHVMGDAYDYISGSEETLSTHVKSKPNNHLATSFSSLSSSISFATSVSSDVKQIVAPQLTTEQEIIDFIGSHSSVYHELPEYKKEDFVDDFKMALKYYGTSSVFQNLRLIEAPHCYIKLNIPFDFPQPKIDLEALYDLIDHKQHP